MGHSGEIQIDQAHRGYAMATDAGSFSSPNPLFMKHLPDAEGQFADCSAYGYQSIEAFLEAARSIREGLSQPTDWDDKLATVRQTLPVTQILEAGRQSLDSGGATVIIERS